MAKSRPVSPAGPGSAHVVSIGTSTPQPSGSDIVDVLAKDIATMKPTRVVILGTEEGRENARRLSSLLGLEKKAVSVQILGSAQSFQDAYQGAAEALRRLEAEGWPPSTVTVHYTAGTKVMAAALVLAAVGQGCQALRYIYSEGYGRPSQPVEVNSAAVRAEGELRRVPTLMIEMRYRSALEILNTLDPSLLGDGGRQRQKTLTLLAQAYSAWDNFLMRRFLQLYRKAEKDVMAVAPEFAIPSETIDALGCVAKVDRSVGVYPKELVFDLFNNALRRLAERRNDDALIRLHRAGELFAQILLARDFGINSSDVEIRRVPPRQRVIFEALRRFEDAKIKLGLRKSYELLAYMDHPVGRAYQKNERLLRVLDERGILVLAHGTQPARGRVALDLIEELLVLFRMDIPDFEKAAQRQQFPWIDNAAVLGRLQAAHDDGKPLETTALPEPERKKAPQRRGGRRA